MCRHAAEVEHDRHDLAQDQRSVQIIEKDEKHRRESGPGPVAQDETQQRREYHQDNQVAQEVKRVVDRRCGNSEGGIKPGLRVERKELIAHAKTKQMLGCKGASQHEQVEHKGGQDDRACLLVEQSPPVLVQSGAEQEIAGNERQDWYRGPKCGVLEKCFDEVEDSRTDLGDGHVRWGMQDNYADDHEIPEHGNAIRYEFLCRHQTFNLICKM